METESAYFYLAFGLGIIWILFGLWYFRSEPSAQARRHGQWWTYLLVWPWLFEKSRSDPQHPDQNGTWRTRVLVTLLFLLMIGAIIFERFFPVSSRTLP